MAESLMVKYLAQLGDPHGKLSSPFSLKFLDFNLRTLIGKSKRIADLKVGLCSHQAILERERDAKGKNPEHYCRKCGINLNIVGVGRCNDYLVLRNPFCRSPICLECVHKGGDVFYQAFKRGLDEYMIMRGCA